MIKKEFEQQAIALYKPSDKVVELVSEIAQEIDGWKRSVIAFPFSIPLGGNWRSTYKVERVDDHSAILVYWDGGGYASAYMLKEDALERLLKAVRAYIGFLEEVS